MASGIFPLRRGDEGFSELSAIADRLGEIASGLRDTSIEYCVPEDACYDGGYIERLYIARDFIRQALAQPAENP